MNTFDAVIIGGGAAGLFCAGVAGQLGLRVLLIDHCEKVAEKIRISGGGRCNFTNTHTSATNFLSDNPRFCRSALARYTPRDFLDLLKRHKVAFHEKHKGQLFCDRSAEDIIRMLLAECDAGAVVRWQPCAVLTVRTCTSDAQRGSTYRYEIDSDRGTVTCQVMVIATGGLSMPKIGASDFGLRIARQFGLDVVPTRPALVPLTFDEAAWQPFVPLAGMSLPVAIAAGVRKERIAFQEDLLFTHRGLSGPAVLQISSYWQPGGTPLQINLSPAQDLVALLQLAKHSSRKRVANILSAELPSRLVDVWLAQGAARGHDWLRPINETPDRALTDLAQQLHQWEVNPTGTEGYRKAEVTAGGVDTRYLSGQTMESRQSGLYFIGEVVDVTGWLGGFNFQWAWASAFACAQAMAAKVLPGRSTPPVP